MITKSFSRFAGKTDILLWGYMYIRCGDFNTLKAFKIWFEHKISETFKSRGSWSPSEFRSKMGNDLKIMHTYFDNIRYVLNSIFLDFVQLIMKGAQSDFFFIFPMF